MKTGSLKRWTIVIALIFIEQAIKLFINSFFLHKSISIIPNAVYFRPMFNRDYSWFNSMLQLGVGKWLHIAIVTIIIVLIVRFYAYLNDRSIKDDKLIDWFFTFLISGAMCSLIDKIFWNGSLDYIALKGLFTFDLKDLFVDISIGLMILFAITGNKEIKSKMEQKAFINGFIQYIFHGNRQLKEAGDEKTLTKK